MAKEYGGTVKKIEGDQAIVEIIHDNFKKIEVVFHKDDLAKYNACREGIKIKYIPSEKKITPVHNFFEKIGIK